MLRGLGPLTPFVRVLDSMGAYDVATRLIGRGGVTSDLVTPGSANIMGRGIPARLLLSCLAVLFMPTYPLSYLTFHQ